MRVFEACVLLTVAAFIDSGESIECYQCKHTTGQMANIGCGDPFIAGANMTICTGATCSKVRSHIKDIVTIARSCVSEKRAEDCKSASISVFGGENCFCSTDRCNGASFLHPSVTSGVALVVCAVVAAILR